MAYSRISGRVGGTVILGTTYYRNGIAQNPYAITEIKIYKQSVTDGNLKMVIPLDHPESSSYPSPLITYPDRPGYYELPLDIPLDFESPNVYIDSWSFVADNPGTTSEIGNTEIWVTKCNKFWIIPDDWYVDDGLLVNRIGFEPLDVKFRSGETRWLEVGLMPLPLYDYDHCRIVPLIPFFEPTISVRTKNCEALVDSMPMTMGLRQGTYRSNPFVCKYLLNTSMFLIGTYEYNITIRLPDGQTIVSPTYTFTVSKGY